MQLSTFLNSLLAISTILLGTSAIPQPDLIPRQQTTTSLSTASTSSRFTSTVTSQCYTSRNTTPLARRPNTTSSTSFTSAQSTVTVRSTSTVTPRPRTTTTTSTARVTSTVTNYNGTIATTTLTRTRLQTTTTTSTTTTGVAITATISTITTSIVPPPTDFTPVSKSLPSPSANAKRDFHSSPLLHRRQRGGNRPNNSFGRNRRNYPGDVSCLTILATGTISTRTQTQCFTLQPSTSTTTRTTTTTIRTTVFPPSQPTPQSTVTQTVTTTSSTTFIRTAIQTTTDTISTTSTSTTTIYAACTDPANRISRLTNYNNRPIDGVQFNYIAFTGDNKSPYDCCVSTLMDGNGAIWTYNGKGECLMGRVDESQAMCMGGQSGQRAVTATVLAGQVGAAEDYIVGNGYCGAWNAVSS